MIFGDGAAALVVAPAPDGAARDVDVLQTYASGPESQVNSIIWPNVEFGCDITVYGPEVKALVKRYLEQMLGELQALPHPVDKPGTLIDAVGLIIPHQANKRMVIDLAEQAGIGRDRMYFNIARVGNTSAASIPLAIHDAVRESVLSVPTRVFTPGFGAGAVAGYAVLRIDPAVVAPERPGPPLAMDTSPLPAPPHTISSSVDVEAAFGSRLRPAQTAAPRLTTRASPPLLRNAEYRSGCRSNTGADSRPTRAAGLSSATARPIRKARRKGRRGSGWP